MRKEFAKILLEIAEKDEKLIVLIGDISHHLLRDFESKYPNRFYNVGICEQTIVGMAAGLAIEGFRPVIHTIAPFCVERAYEQIKVDLCYQNLDVTIVSVGGSFDYAHLGCTHHCYEDISILRPLPNIQIYAPGNVKEFETLFKKTWANKKPKYFKIINDEHTQNIDICPGDCAIINSSSDDGNGIVIFVNGYLLDSVLKVKNVKEYTVVYMPTIKPLTSETKDKISRILYDTPRALVVEENSIIGGLGDTVFQVASELNKATLIKKLGIPDKFLEEYGKAAQHREKLGLTVKNIEEKINELQRA